MEAQISNRRTAMEDAEDRFAARLQEAWASAKTLSKLHSRQEKSAQAREYLAEVQRLDEADSFIHYHFAADYLIREGD